MTTFNWMANQLAARFSEPIEQPRFNPRPPGVIRPGSATQHVLFFLRKNPDRYFTCWQLIHHTGLSRKAVNHACLYLRAQELISVRDDMRRVGYLLYGIASNPGANS